MERQTATISLIMPTLNSGGHISVALESVAAQTYKCAELIVVDSGSTDGTLGIIKTYKQGGLPIRVFSAPGLSPALARNTGLDATTGSHIAFCDSDDLMMPDMLETMLDTATRTASDITVCDFDIVYLDRKIKAFSQLPNGHFNPVGSSIIDYYYKFCAAPKPNNYVWSRLYRRDFLKKSCVRFPDVRYSEDHLFNLSLLFAEPKIAHVGRSLYAYIQHDNSVTRGHVRKGSHGQRFLEAFRTAAHTLKNSDSAIANPILGIYAYTRLKSILFYARQADLPEAETSEAISVFIDDSTASTYLKMCIEQDYIGSYCLMHGLTPEHERALRNMLRACINKEPLPDMRQTF